MLAKPFVYLSVPVATALLLNTYLSVLAQTTPTTSTQPQTVQSKPPQPQAVQSPVAQPQTVQSKPPQPQAVQSPVTQPQTVQSKPPQPQAVQSPVAQPQTVQSKPPQPQAVQSPVAQPQTVQSKPPQPQAIQSPVAQPQTVQATPPQPQAVQSPVAQPQTVQAIPPQPQAVQSPVAQPQTVQATPPQPQAVQSPVAQPQAVQAIPPQPQAVQSPVAQPQTIEAVPPQPQADQPQPAQNVQAIKIESATLTLQQFLLRSDQRIPAWILQKARGIAIIPKVVQAGFFFGGRRGSGILMVRDDLGQWSHPAFVSLTGGSFGLQFGAQTSDVVLVFMDKAAAYNALSQSFKLGGNISVSAGPVGGDIVSPSDPSPQVYTYARNQGLFAGVALEGAKIGFDRESSDQYYGKTNLTVLQIFKNIVPLNTTAEVANLQQLLDRSAASLPGQQVSSQASTGQALP